MTKIARVLLPVGATALSRAGRATSSDGLDYASIVAGTVDGVTVAYDPGLGDRGAAQAAALLQAAGALYQQMENDFAIVGGTVTAVVAPLSPVHDGSGGGYHYGCDFAAGGVLYLDATFASTTVDPAALLAGLFVAELSESFMGPRGGGWGCGYSNGEGLSRLLAEQATAPGTLAAYATGPAWADAGFPDWVSKTEQTDQNPISTGCAVVCLYWLLSLGCTVPQIIQASGDTLADNYRVLTGRDTAYADLLGAVRSLTIRSDNPFGAA